MTEHKIEQLFKDALGNLEADVNPNVWTNIEQGLQAPLPANPVSGGSSVLKSAGILGQMTVKSLILISAVTVSVIGTAIYFAVKKDSKVETATVIPQIMNNYSPAVNNKTEPSTGKDEGINKTKNVASEKPTASGIKEQHAATQEKSNSENPFNSNPKETTSNSVASSEASATNPSVQDNPAEPAKVTAANPLPVEENKINNTPGQNQEAAKEEFAPGFAKIEDYLAMDDFNRKGLPNSFSPNGDRINDVFKIKTHDLKTLEVIIFDLGGKEIYSWKSLTGEWDGKLPDGAEAPAGDYYYSLNAETVDGKICIGQSFLKLFR